VSPASDGRPDSLSGMATRRTKAPAGTKQAADGWLLLIYKVPSESSRARVAVWRELKRLGGFYVQQAVCVLPDRDELRAGMVKVREKVTELGGSSVFLTLTDVEPDVRDQFVEGFRTQSAKEYAEIVEECETKFVKEIEFERFRENYTFEEAEEIRQDLEKLRRWLAKVEDRDWMDADGKELARARVADCERLLEEFEADVYEHTEGKV
jgi:ChrB-like protein